MLTLLFCTFSLDRTPTPQSHQAPAVPRPQAVVLQILTLILMMTMINQNLTGGLILPLLRNLSLTKKVVLMHNLKDVHVGLRKTPLSKKRLLRIKKDVVKLVLKRKLQQQLQRLLLKRLLLKNRRRKRSFLLLF